MRRTESIPERRNYTIFRYLKRTKLQRTYTIWTSRLNVPETFDIDASRLPHFNQTTICYCQSMQYFTPASIFITKIKLGNSSTLLKLVNAVEYKMIVEIDWKVP